MSDTIRTFPSGFKRSSNAGKLNYLLVRDGVMYERWVRHLSNASNPGEARNWLQAGTAQEGSDEELECFRESFLRHAEAWLRGEEDEDHAAAMFFNVDGAERVKMLIRERREDGSRE